MICLDIWQELRRVWCFFACCAVAILGISGYAKFNHKMLTMARIWATTAQTSLQHSVNDKCVSLSVFFSYGAIFFIEIGLYGLTWADTFHGWHLIAASKSRNSLKLNSTLVWIWHISWFLLSSHQQKNVTFLHYQLSLSALLLAEPHTYFTCYDHMTTAVESIFLLHKIALIFAQQQRKTLTHSIYWIWNFAIVSCAVCLKNRCANNSNAWCSTNWSGRW